MSFAWVTPASASFVKESAVDPIEQSYRIPITNPQNGMIMPSLLVISAATLDTMSPVHSQLPALRGMIFLTMHMSSGPIQRNYGDPLWGDYFSGLKPIPASALRYVAASGRSFTATRSNPIDQTNNPNGASDDGMVDAMYYFTVPITNRRGTLIISPTRTTGVEYHDFTGFAPVVLQIGGPVKVALVFPMKLTVTVPNPKTSSPVAGETFGNDLNLFATMLAGLLAGFVFLKRRRTRRSHRPTPVIVVESALVSNAPTHDFEQAPMPRPQPIRPKVAEVVETLRVDVLGPLSIAPVNALASDPVLYW